MSISSTNSPLHCDTPPPSSMEGRRPGGEDGGDVSSQIFSPSPEVKANTIRKNYTAAYKIRILELADACLKNGDVGALLRKEGLYSSHLSKWREQRERGDLLGSTSKKRGVKLEDPAITLAENNKLKRENETLRKRLEKAEVIIDFQKKTSALLRMIDLQEEKKS